MAGSVARVDPNAIAMTLKEAVVDSLINATYERISGLGSEGKQVFGARPRAVFASGFLLPPLLDQGPGDLVELHLRVGLAAYPAGEGVERHAPEPVQRPDVQAV